MKELLTESKKIKNWWYYFLNFYFWCSIILITTLTVTGIIFYFEYISPNIELWTQNYDFVIQSIEKAKPIVEEYLNSSS